MHQTEAKKADVNRSCAAFLGLTVALLAACAAPAPESLQVRESRALAALDTNAACEILLSISQKEIAIERQVPTSSTSPGYFGPGWGYAVIGGMLDYAMAASRDSATERDIVPIRKALANQDINAKFLQALGKKATEMPCKVAGANRIVTPSTQLETEQAINASPSPFVMFVAIAYSMSPDSRYLTAQAFAALVPRTDSSRGEFLQHAVYSNQLRYTKKIEDFGNVHELNRIWLARDGARLYQGLDELAEGIAMLLVLDLAAGRADDLTGSPGERRQIALRDRVVEISRDPRGALQVITN